MGDRKSLTLKRFALTRCKLGRSFWRRSETLTKVFRLTPRDTEVLGAREIPKHDP